MKAPAEVLEGLDAVIDRLEEAAREGVVVVEGLRDEEALGRLGVEGHIRVLHRGSSLLAFCEELVGESRDVTILVDWDTKGEALARRLRAGLTQGRVRVDVRTREELRRLTRGAIHAVEELPSFYRRVQAAAASKGPPHGPPGQWKERKERTENLRAARQRRASRRGP